MAIDADTYLSAAVEAIGRLSGQPIAEAAELIAEAVREDGVVHAFGCGHSEALAMEIAGRAGGLIGTNKIALRDLVLYGGEPSSILQDPGLERDPSVAH